MEKRRIFHFNVKKAKRPISLKLGLLTSSLTFILIFFFSLFIVNISKSKVMEQLKDKGLSSLLSLSEISKSAVVSNDYMFLVNLPQMIAHEKDILYLILVDNTGRCLVHTNEKFLDTQLKDKISQKALKSSKVEKPFIQEYYHKNHGYKVYDISKGIGIGNRKWATLRLGISTKRLNLMTKRMYQLSFLGSIAVALLAFVITFFLSRITVRPLYVLKKRLDDLSEKGEVKEVSIKTGDEAEELAHSFNRMLKGWSNLVNALKESKDYTDNIIKSMIDTLIVINPEGTIRTVNQATLDLLGYDEKELIGQPAGVLFAEEEEEEEEEEQQLFKGRGLKRLLKIGFVKNIEVTYLTKDKRKIPLLFSGAVMRGDDGKIQGMVCVALDISKRKQAEEELKKKMQDLERFHKVTVGREMEMVKLKEEVNSLLEKLGQPKKYEAPEKIKETKKR